MLIVAVIFLCYNRGPLLGATARGHGRGPLQRATATDIPNFTIFDIWLHLIFDGICHLMTFAFWWHLTFQDLWHFMTFDISWHLTFNDIWHWHKTFHDIWHFCKNQIVGRNLRIVAHWWTLCESHLLRLLDYPPIGLPPIGLTPNWTNLILTTRMGVDQLFRDRENVTIPLETSQFLKVGPPPFGIPPIWSKWRLVQLGVSPNGG